jgi:hypothetical protein
MTAAADIRKLSKTRPDHRDGFASFRGRCSWLDAPGDYSPDTFLLAALEERVRRLEGQRLGHGAHVVEWRDEARAPNMPRVGELRTTGWPTRSTSSRSR